MNQRIKALLLNERNMFVNGVTESDNKIYIHGSEENLEKFAELIVRECVKLCEHESNDDEYDQYDMGMSVKAEDIKASIMKTFGVK